MTMTDQPHTPTTEEIRDYVEMGGEPRPWEPPTPEGEALEIKRREAFDRWLAAHDAAIEAAAERRGAEETLAYLIEDYPAYASHEEIRAWIQARLDHVRNADQIGGKICGLDGCESDEIAGHMQDGTLICYDCAREGEMEGGE